MAYVQPLISIIVPVYKAEKYIRRCLDSIKAQTLKDFEAILVDDGSPDDSGKICDEYAQKDSRFRVIHQTNGGVSRARQTGLDNATGEYVIHADPDDWMEPNMLQSLYDKAKETNADMVICDFTFEYSDHAEIYNCNLSSDKLDHMELFRLILGQKLFAALWNKLIKHSTIKNFNISFDTNLSLWEDLTFICDLLQNEIHTVYLNEPYYHYDNFTNSTSIVRSNNIKILKSAVAAINHVQNLIVSESYKEELYEIKKCPKYMSFEIKEIGQTEFTNLFVEINEQLINDQDCPSYIKESIKGNLEQQRALREKTYLLQKIKWNFQNKIIKPLKLWISN